MAFLVERGHSHERQSPAVERGPGNRAPLSRLSGFLQGEQVAAFPRARRLALVVETFKNSTLEGGNHEEITAASCGLSVFCLLRF